MDCPNCKTKMDREDGVLYFKTPVVGPVYDVEHKEFTATDDLSQFRTVDATYQCPDCGLEAHWQRKHALEITYDPRLQGKRPEQPKPERIWGYGSARIPKVSIGAVTCTDCKHNDHEAGKCDRCNCGESAIRFLA